MECGSVLSFKKNLTGAFKLEQHQIYKDDFADYLLCLALDVAEGMLKNGGEISRVEDTVERICYAYGAEHVEVFTIISYINAAIRMKDGSYSHQLRRVKSTGTNLNTLESLNDLSRRICRTTPPLAEFESEIKKAKKTKPYSNPVYILGSVMTVSAFALLFGGHIIDGIVAGVIGAVIAVIELYSSKRLNAMAKTVISSLVASVIAGIAVKLGIGRDGGTIIIGSIMLLVPGLSFGSAMRDLLYGDLLAGTLKTVQACLSALMIAFGYMIATLIVGGGVI